jgi:hypothetical protein
MYVVPNIEDIFNAKSLRIGYFSTGNVFQNDTSISFADKNGSVCNSHDSN